MATNPFEATVRERDGFAIIDLHGVINASAKPALDAAFAEANDRLSGTILLNFRGVDYVNSTGIALIVGLLGRARKAGRSLLACNLTEHYCEIFQITRLADYISIYTDEEDAVAQSVAVS
jgi:anti-anti-sigma factor